MKPNFFSKLKTKDILDFVTSVSNLVVAILALLSAIGVYFAYRLEFEPRIFYFLIITVLLLIIFLLMSVRNKVTYNHYRRSRFYTISSPILCISSAASSDLPIYNTLNFKLNPHGMSSSEKENLIAELDRACGYYIIWDDNMELYSKDDFETILALILSRSHIPMIISDISSKKNFIDSVGHDISYSIHMNLIDEPEKNLLLRSIERYRELKVVNNFTSNQYSLWFIAFLCLVPIYILIAYKLLNIPLVDFKTGHNIPEITNPNTRNKILPKWNQRQKDSILHNYAVYKIYQLQSHLSDQSLRLTIKKEQPQEPSDKRVGKSILAVPSEQNSDELGQYSIAGCATFYVGKKIVGWKANFDHIDTAKKQKSIFLFSKLHYTELKRHNIGDTTKCGFEKTDFNDPTSILNYAFYDNHGNVTIVGITSSENTKIIDDYIANSLAVDLLLEIALFYNAINH